ncbi:MAG: peptide chain release factor N(5)-glutamine methyltransferase [Sphingomonadaceae bacterium]|nr:peptide chain release factor N(5)-glutamine methyltransferase [Sphingomonadaceae bacterium]
MAEAARRLAAVSDTPRLDAELLLAHALGISREALLFGNHPISPEFDALIARRLAHEPVAYITGTRAFWTIELAVTPDVLIPRPDSETLIEAAVAHFGVGGPKRVLDLGTGSGALLLAALDQWPGATGVGVDASEAALAVARANGVRIAPGRAEFRLGEWGEGIDKLFDLILCNPPYVEADAALPPDVARWEPAAALYAGPDGLDACRALAPQLARLLAPGGSACVEIGAGQADAASALFAAQGFDIARRSDLAGMTRCLTLLTK